MQHVDVTAWPRLLVEGIDSVERELPFSLEAVATEVARLRGGIVTLEFVDRRLWISGGPSRFTATVSFGENERIYDVIGDDRADGDIELILGNQPADWPERLTVGYDRCLAIAKEFADGDQLDFTTWHEQ